jgi:hypothetical protein
MYLSISRLDILYCMSNSIPYFMVSETSLFFQIYQGFMKTVIDHTVKLLSGLCVCET